MDNLLYVKEVICPICRAEFVTRKVRHRRLRVLERHADSFTVYKDINPIYYYIWVCPECGYSASESEFDNVTPEQKNIFNSQIRPKWKQKFLGGIRTVKEAEACFKLALLTAEVLNKSKGYIGGLCLRLSWIYREIKSSREMEFAKHALACFEDAYQNERFPNAGLDEITMGYLIGELNRRVGKYREAIQWYAKVLDNPEIKKNRQLQLKAREQWGVAKEQHDEEKAKKHRNAIV